MSTQPRLAKWRTQGTKAVRVARNEMGLTPALLFEPRYRRLMQALLLTNAVSVLLFGLRLVGAENFRYWFMLWNLALAWVAPIIAWWLLTRLQKTRWLSWQNVLLSVAWLGFLPNSFYMVSDLIHVQQTGEVNIIFDAVLFTSFILNGFIAGYLGTFFIHRELLKRFSARRVWVAITAIFALCGYAIYLGRVLRWNTWDALFQPAALLFDVSDTFIHPLNHPQAFVVTASFTILVTSFYVLAWETWRSLNPHHP